MVSMKTEIASPDARMQARMKRVRDMHKVPGVRVVPSDGEGFTAEDMRRLLKHPTAGAFRMEGDMEWPLDDFTHRMLKEGSIKLVEGQKPEEAPKPQQSAGQSKGGGQ
jgi:hypothetical protein